MDLMEQIRTSKLITKLAKYKTVCVIMSVIGIVANIIRDGAIVFELWTHHISLRITTDLLVLALLSIILGFISCIIDVVFIFSVQKKHHTGLLLWVILSTIILLVSTISAITAFAILERLAVGLSFMFDIIRIAIQLYLVTSTIPVFSLCFKNSGKNTTCIHTRFENFDSTL